MRILFPNSIQNLYKRHQICPTIAQGRPVDVTEIKFLVRTGQPLKMTKMTMFGNNCAFCGNVGELSHAGKMHINCRLLPEHIVCKITQRNNMREQTPVIPLSNRSMKRLLLKYINTNKTYGRSI